MSQRDRLVGYSEVRIFLMGIGHHNKGVATRLWEALAFLTLKERNTKPIKSIMLSRDNILNLTSKDLDNLPNIGVALKAAFKALQAKLHNDRQASNR